jgi:hypothetical protein
MADSRETLVRKAFEAERNYHYQLFRQQKWELAEVVAILPDPAEREEVLLGYWNLRGEELYPQYRASVAHLSMAELRAEGEKWQDAIAGAKEYREMLAEAASRPANDNERGIER